MASAENPGNGTNDNATGTEKRKWSLPALGRTAAHGGGGGKTPAATPPVNTRFVIKPSKVSCIVLGSLTGVVVLAAAGLYFWQSGQIAELSEKVHQKQTELASSEKISRNLESVTALNLETRGELQHLETSVTEGHYIPTLLHQTEELARATNLHVGAIRPTLEPAPSPPPASKDGAATASAAHFVAQPYDKEHIDMDLSGRYWDLAQLLYKLTVFPKIMTVESATMTPANTGPGDHSKLNVKLRLTGFIFKADAAAAEGGAATNGVKMPSAAAAGAPIALPNTKPAANLRATVAKPKA